MSTPSWPWSPDFPDEPAHHPYPPARPMPKREGPVAIPIVDLPSTSPQQALRDRRRLMLSGPLDAARATDLAAELMALDGRSADDVELIVTSDGGPLTDALVVLDVIGSMRAQVATTCLGCAKGTAAIVLACGTGARTASVHAVITLRVDDDERVEGSADQIERQLGERRAVRQQVLSILAAATGRPAEDLDAELDHGRPLDVTAATAAGIIDSG